jgi:hypothetical protein
MTQSTAGWQGTVINRAKNVTETTFGEGGFACERLRQADAWEGLPYGVTYGIVFDWNAARTAPISPQAAPSLMSPMPQHYWHQLQKRLWAAFSRTVEEAKSCLPLLISAGAGERKGLFQRLLTMSHPLAVSLVALEEYDRTGRESVLLNALSLLESWGPVAWPALLWVAQLARPECELFTGLVARCSGVPRRQRLEGLTLLAGNPYSAVRLGVLERLADFPPDEAKPILEKLAADTDPDVQMQAAEQLQLLS